MGGHDPKQTSEPGETAPEIPYATKRNPITGAITVHYECRQCSAPLHSPLSDAGNREECPQCGIGFIVPGTSELNARAEQLQREREAEKCAEKLRADATRKRQEQERMSRAKERIENSYQLGINRPQATNRSGSTRLIVYEVAGGLLVIIGVFMLIGGGSMSTTFSGTHNIGLLNARSNWVIIGSVFTGAGVLTMAVAAVGNALGYWAAQLDTRLEKLNATQGDQHGQR